MSLLRRIHDRQDAVARDELTVRHAPLVRSLARRYADRGEELEDLVQVGQVGLVKAMDRFDPHAGYRFVSFAVPNITGEIRRHFRDHCWAAPVPRSMQELDAKVHAATKDLAAAAGGREPTVGDLAAALGVPVAAIEAAKAAGSAFNALSTDAPIGDGIALLDTYGSVDGSYAAVDDLSMLHDSLTVLDARERVVLHLRFEEDLLQREIADRIGVSQMQVSRIISSAIQQMRENLDAAGEHVPSIAER